MDWRQWFLQAQNMLIGTPRRALITMLVVVLLVPATRGWLIQQAYGVLNLAIILGIIALLCGGIWSQRPRRRQGRH